MALPLHGHSGAGERWTSVGSYVYDPDHPIGRGSFADVFLGHSTAEPSRQVAVKRIHKNRLAKASNRRLIDSEVSILKGLAHPNVVRLYDCITAGAPDEYMCLVMEYCDGGDLNDYIQKHAPMGEDLIANLVAQLAAALQYLRERNIVHRDLKPQNILLASKPGTLQFEIKLADFGFARHLFTQDMAATFCGSPLYMAPEVLEGGEYDAKADLWSVGTIVFQCLTGHSPFRASSIQQLKELLRKASGRYDFPPATSKPLCHLISTLLQVNSEERISFHDFFQHPFLQCARSLPESMMLSRTAGNGTFTPAPSSGAACLGSSSNILDDRSYVMVDKQFVELNTIADQLAVPGGDSPWGDALVAVSQGVRNTTTQLLDAARRRTSSDVASHGSLHRNSGGVGWPNATAWITASTAPGATTIISERDIKDLVLRIERVIKPATAVMFVAANRVSRDRPGAGNAGTQRLESMLLYSKALSIFRKGVSLLFVGGTFHLSRHPAVKPHILELRRCFNDCLRYMEDLRAAGPPTHVNLEVAYSPLSASVGLVATASEMLYESAITLCRDAAADEALFKLGTAEVAYSRALVLFNLLLSEASGSDVDVLQSYSQSTVRRLDAVVAKERAVARGELDTSVSASATLQHRAHAASPREFVMSSPVPIYSPARLAADGSPLLSTSASTVFCANCGSSIGSQQNFCVKCGSPRTALLALAGRASAVSPPRLPEVESPSLAARVSASVSVSAAEELDLLRQQVANLQGRLRDSMPLSSEGPDHDVETP